MNNLLVIADLHHASPRIPALTDHIVDLGWSVTVLTTILGEDASDRLGFPERYLERVRVIETPFPGDVLKIFRKLLIKAGFSSKESFTEQIKHTLGIRRRHSLVDRALWLYQEIFAFPDGMRAWRRPALKVARELIGQERFDCMMSSSPYPTSHVIAHVLQQEFGLNWTADFRDTWTQNPVYPYSCIRRRIERMYEEHVLKNANAFITVSEEYAYELRKYFNKAVYVIPNGFQGDVFTENQGYTTGKFTLTYTGTMYLGKQNPEKPLRVIKHLIDHGQIDRQDIEVRFYGRKENWLQLLIEELGLSDVVIQNGQVPRFEARKRQQDSQILLFFNWEDSQNRGLSHLKFYEYLRTGRKILATGGIHGSDIENILRETQAGLFVVTEHEIEHALTDLYNEYKRKGSISNNSQPETIQKYSYLERAKDLNDILCRLT